MSPALAGGFFTTEPQEKSATIFSMNRFFLTVIKKKKKLNYFIKVMFPIFMLLLPSSQNFENLIILETISLF